VTIVNRVVEQEMVEAQETLRCEEIDINTEGRRVENKNGRLPSDQI
jgi:stress response protein YsnF